MDETIENLGEIREATSSTASRRKVTVQVPKQTERDNFYTNPKKSPIKPVALSLIEPHSRQFVLCHKAEVPQQSQTFLTMRI